MNFNEYWKAKAAKRRKAWVATARRFADEHAQMEEIRKKVYTPLDYNNTFSFDGYKEVHLVEQNPIVGWEQMKCRFMESGLRDAMSAEGADLTSLAMQVSQESIVGVEAPCPLNRWEGFYLPNKVYDYEQVYHAWLKRVYAICTDVETVRLTYGEVTMTIKRYSKEGAPFGYYELNPCEQLTKAAMMLQETDFNMLNVATLLMEMDATWKLRQEELNYYAKKLRLRTMKAAVATDEIEFTLWDDKKLTKKVEEYIAKGYTINVVILELLRPFKAALKKYFDAAVERSLRDEVPTLRNFNYYSPNRDNFFEQELRPLLEAELDGVELEIKGKIDKTITINYYGYQCCLESSSTWSSIRLIPHVGYEKYTIPLPPSTPLSAIGGFVRQMPTINHRTDEYLVKAMQIYDKLMCQQNEEYHAVVEHLGTLAAKHAGKPVGKLMKYLRWSAADLLDKKGKWLCIPTIAVTGDTSFCYTEREVKDFVTSTYEDVFKEKWVDAECRYLYGADPETTDADEWIKAHSKKGIIFGQARWAHDVRSFVGHGSDDTFLSVEFINEKL
jgi:hypothetical protein